MLATWAYHRIHRNDDRWPRRLAWCLPMRVLVEQTHSEVERVLASLGVLWDGKGDHTGRVGAHLLMGGSNAGDWHHHPEDCAVLIGTQDMLLSRALNRGYGAAPARWPIDFGLLSRDCLWVLDEVQLMDVGLATSAQLDLFRGEAGRPTASFWMSATLQRNWLASVDTAGMVERLPLLEIPEDQQHGGLWDIRKKCNIEPNAKPPALPARIAEEHARFGFGRDGPTLVVVNTVRRAIELADAIAKTPTLKKRGATDLRVVHSRFRPHERLRFAKEFLNREACGPGADRIIVSTQVVEAGVDISSRVLFTDVAPWPSLVQRFGRAARWGGTAEVFVIDTAPKDDGAAAPYAKAELDAALDAISRVGDVGPAGLEHFERHVLDAASRAELYPYSPSALVVRDEIDELFDTTPDLTGAHLDVSRYIRSGDERDIQVFWDQIPEKGAVDKGVRPTREALCSVPVGAARTWLFDGKRLKRPRSAWIRDYLKNEYRVAEANDLYPGQTLLIDSKIGGYDWDPTSGRGLGATLAATGEVPPVERAIATPDDEADGAQDDESQSATSVYQTIGTHGREVAKKARAIAAALCPELSDRFELAGRLHDVGKIHEAFQGCIKDVAGRPAQRDLAKAPKAAWHTGRSLYPMGESGHRRGFRHELASAIAMFSILRRHDPEHAALLGPWRDVLGAGAPGVPGASPPTAIEREVLALSADDFDLIAYLVMSHHGKVRASLHATPDDQDAATRTGRVRIRGLEDGDALPPVRFGDGDDLLPPSQVDLGIATMGLHPATGRSWTDRALGLLARLGPFELAWLEAILRAADVRASKDTIVDPMLTKEGD